MARIGKHITINATGAVGALLGAIAIPAPIMRGIAVISRSAALVARPAIHECVVFGRPDEKWGEAVQVAIELREGAYVSAEDIIAFAKQQVGSVQAPKQVHFVDSLPRSAVAKVQRREIRAMTERAEGI